MWFSMLRLVALSSLCFVTLGGAQAATEVTGSDIQPLATHSLVLDIAKQGETMIAVGDRGHLFRFTDGWQQVSSPSRALLTKATLLTPELGWAVGHDATILHTQDGGNSWVEQMRSPEIEKPFLDVLFFDAEHGIAIGAYGLFYRTQDGGKQWQQEFHTELLYEEDQAYLDELKAEDESLYLKERSTLLPHFNRVVRLADDRLLMVGELGLAAQSQDKGLTWQRIDFPYEGSLFNILVAKQGIYVLGLRGHLFKSEGDLEQWQEIELTTKSTLNGGLVLSDDKVRLVGNGGVVIDVASDDSVTMVTQRQGENLVAIGQDKTGTLWIAGTKGLVALQQK
ncbi:hypothetical protein K0I63_09250 [Shewanella rhizosphaerae]|uniref:WD40/YVTN/BNR-like repeat-containing protein n=1 Tax=Shewanella rhizosphaerae TaxID=2864207 RepID=UPI001C6608E0|nr:hypothetical protein [Shewanella rhizosphaerae]QYK14645.1 hypothetical protein K0I63_09250 [Shewanella rhizosphaerae]